MAIRGCEGGTGGGRIVRDGTRSSVGISRRILNSRLIDGSVRLRDSIGIPLAAIRRAASLESMRSRLKKNRELNFSNLGVIIARLDIVELVLDDDGSSSLKCQ